MKDTTAVGEVICYRFKSNDRKSTSGGKRNKRYGALNVFMSRNPVLADIKANIKRIKANNLAVIHHQVLEE